MKLLRTFLISASLILSTATGIVRTAQAAPPRSADFTERTAETQVKNLIKPLLDQYCAEDCKLMGVKVVVDVNTPDQISPGFDDIEVKKGFDLAPVSAQVRLLIDDKVGPISRGKLLELLQQYLDTLDYPVKIDTQITHFPLPHGTDAKIAAIRSKIEKTFQTNTHDLIQEYCPRSCILTDFNLQTEVVNIEELQYGSGGDYIQEGDVAVKIKQIDATLLMDQDLTIEEQANILQMVRLKNSGFKNLSVNGKTLKFPKALVNNMSSTTAPERIKDRRPASISSEKLENSTKNDSSDSKTSTANNSNQNNSTNNNQEKSLKEDRYSRTEKIERVENGDAVQKELDKFKIAGLIFAFSVLALLLFIAMSTLKTRPGEAASSVQRVFQNMVSDPVSNSNVSASPISSNSEARTRNSPYSMRFEVERLHDELNSIYAQNPKVAKHVFSKVLTEEGVETTAECINLFGEGIVIEMLRDPSLQTDLNELLEFYSKNPTDLTDEEKLILLKKLYNRTVSGKLAVIGNRSTRLFDFLSEMDGEQILDLIKSESLTVKSIILTQCDSQKRAHIYAHLDPEIRMELLTELSRIDYLPKDFIYNVAVALKRKKVENPKLNTEALPGSEVLVSLLERTGLAMQKTVIHGLENANPDSARTIKSKLISIDTLLFLRDGQLLEVILSLKHEELLHFLKGSPDAIRKTIFSKSPPELVLELEDELAQIRTVSRETYQNVERKIINRVRLMATEGQLNLIETNDRMFANSGSMDSGGITGDRTRTMDKIRGMGGAV